jgi:hypothetical protein
MIEQQHGSTYTVMLLLYIHVKQSTTTKVMSERELIVDCLFKKTPIHTTFMLAKNGFQTCFENESKQITNPCRNACKIDVVYVGDVWPIFICFLACCHILG